MYNINAIIIILLENISNLQIRSSTCGLCNHKYEYTYHRICIRERSVHFYNLGTLTTGKEHVGLNCT